MEPLFLHCRLCHSKEAQYDGMDLFVDQEQDESPLFVECRTCRTLVAKFNLERTNVQDREDVSGSGEAGSQEQQ